MQIDPSIAVEYRGRTVLVTGASGFIGSHVTDALVELGANVHILLRDGSRRPENLPDSTFDAVTRHTGDLVELHAVQSFVERACQAATAPPIIFHLAAQAHVGESWKLLYRTFSTNIMGTLNLLQAITHARAQAHTIDMAGTAEEYTSDDEGSSPYAVSKSSAAQIALSYHKTYGLPVVRTRMFNNFGPRQSPRYFTGTIITQALSRDQIVMGNPDARRDYTYVLDGVRGHLYAGVRGKPGATYAIGDGKSISALEWAKMIVQVGKEMGEWGEKEIEIDTDRFRPGASETQNVQADYSLLAQDTGWRPVYTREEGLRETIAYYDQNRSQWESEHDW